MKKPNKPILFWLRILKVLMLSRQKLVIESYRMCILIISSEDANTGIQKAIHIICQQVGKDHRNSNDQKHALHHRVVTLGDRASQHKANASIGEQGFQQYRTTYNEANGGSEPREQR